MTKFNEPYITGNEKLNLEALMLSNGPFYGSGKFSKVVYDLISHRINSSNVLLTDSCTSALDVIALILAQKSKKRTILCPSYTFSSTASAFIKAGFKVRFIDVNPITLMIDETHLHELNLLDVAALVVVHYAGQLCDMPTIKTFCESHEILLVEDAAQAFGCELFGQHAGTFGDFGAFSFHETKNIHCGLGGALVVRDGLDYQLAEYICDRGSNRSDLLKGLVDKYTWVSIGGSYTLSEISAAFLAAQLGDYTEFLENRKSMWLLYHKNLSNQAEILTQKIQNGVISNYHAFYVIFKSEEACDLVRTNLLAEEIHAYIGYVPLHSSPFAKYTESCICAPLPHTEDISNRVLRLPLHHKITTSEIDKICQIIKS
jgi:dTDP-4-amino-4,6-dideoxygalactose transaminase